MSRGFQPVESCSGNDRILPSITRRGFFTLAAALGLSVAGSALDGFFVRAWADEAGKTSFRIYVAKRWEVPIAFLDLSDLSNPASIVGASVTITSLYNGKVATGTTDSNGVAFIDIAELSEPVANPQDGVPTEYAFYGSVLVEAEGYRVFETGKMRIVGGKQVETPTERLDGRPYVRCATIDGWDIQYAKATTFAATKANIEEHEAIVKIADGSTANARSAQGVVDIAFGQDDGVVYSQTVSFDANGLATAAFRGAFFSTREQDAAGSFAPGKPVCLAADLLQDAKSSFVLSTNAEVADGVEEDDTEEESVCGVDTFIDDGSSGDFSFTLPESLPFMGGESVGISGMLPSWPLSVTVDPFGLFIGGVGCAGTLHRHGNAWQRDTFQNSLDSYRKTKSDWEGFCEAFREGNSMNALFGEKASKVGRMPLAKSRDLNFQCGGMVILQWGDRLTDGADCFRGDMQLYAILSGAFSATQQVLVMQVPLFVRFELTVAARALFDIGVTAQKDTHALSMSEGSSIAFTLKPEVALTLGVGVADLLSVGIRGAGYFNFYLNVPFQPPENKPSARFCVGAGVGASVVIQAALFKASVGLYSVDWPNLYDNWAEGSTPQTLQSGDGAPYAFDAYYVTPSGYSMLAPSDDALMRSGVAPLSFALQATPVTQAELQKTAEFVAVPEAGRWGVSGERQIDPADEAESSGLYEYRPVQRPARQGGLAGGESGYEGALKSLGASGASMSSGLVYGDAFSDPRMQTVMVDGAPWLFRVLSATYEGDASSGAGARTRLAVAKWNAGAERWDAAQVIDFVPDYGSNNAGAVIEGPARSDLFDYDFSVVSASEVATLGQSSWADGGVVRVFLTSGTRSGDAAATMGSALAHTVGTFLSIGDDLSVKTAHSFLDVHGASGQGVNPLANHGLFRDYTYSTIAYPTVMSDGGPSENVTVVFGFYRLAQTADDLVGASSDSAYVEVPASAAFKSDGTPLGDLAFSAPVPSQGDYLSFAKEKKRSVSSGIIGRNASNANEVYIGCHYVTDKADPANPSQTVQVVREFAIVRQAPGSGASSSEDLWLYGGDAPAKFVYPWKGVGLETVGLANALCATEDRLVARGFTKNLSVPSKALVQTDLTLDKGISLTSFAIDQSSGMLYYATAREGVVAGDMQEDGVRAASETVTDYRIWATRCVTAGGKTGFIEPFPLIQTQEPIDSLTFVDVDGSYCFMVNSIVDMQNSLSNIVFYRLPYLRNVRLVEFQSVNRFVCAGEDEAFVIAVCNEGNVAVGSFTLQVEALLPDGGSFQQQILLDLSKTDEAVPLPQAEDASDQRGAASVAAEDDAAETCVFVDPEFDLATRAGMLNPGKARSYRFVWRVPEEFSGVTDLQVVVLGNDESADGEGGAPGVAAGEAGRFKNAQPLSSLGQEFAHSPISLSVDVRSGAEAGQESDESLLSVSKSRYAYGDGGTNGWPEDSGDPVGPGEPGGSASGEGDSSGSASQGAALSNTGDGAVVAAGAAALVAGLGVAGAGIAAWQLHEQGEGLDG